MGKRENYLFGKRHMSEDLPIGAHHSYVVASQSAVPRPKDPLKTDRKERFQACRGQLRYALHEQAHPAHTRMGQAERTVTGASSSLWSS